MGYSLQLQQIHPFSITKTSIVGREPMDAGMRWKSEGKASGKHLSP